MPARPRTIRKIPSSTSVAADRLGVAAVVLSVISAAPPLTAVAGGCTDSGCACWLDWRVSCASGRRDRTYVVLCSLSTVLRWPVTSPMRLHTMLLPHAE
jgi:hypothetical protein